MDDQVENKQQEKQQEPEQQENRNVEPHRATMILVFGIIGIVLCGIFAILAWVLGNQDLAKMNSGFMDISGKDTTNIGRILGIVGVCLWAAGIIFWFIMAMGMAGGTAY